MTHTATTSLTASGQEAISRRVDVPSDITASQLSIADFDDFYEIERTTAQIIAGEYKQIALQFPDELLHDSVPIYRRLKEGLGAARQLYVLADTSYGSCCVDEVAAQHVEADAIVHYGHACLTQTSRLPVIYVFGKKKIDPQLCVASVTAAFKEHYGVGQPRLMVLKHDVVYTHRAEEIRAKFMAAFESLGTSVSYTPVATIPNLLNGVPPQKEPDPGDFAMVYIGGESLCLTNLLMTNGLSDIFSYNPETNLTQLESTRTNKLLMRRYAAVQKARDADVFGILVGTLGVASYLPLIEHLRTLLIKHHKKCYTISVGKLNPAKLANFMDIECFVLVACPENSLIDSKDFFRPIVTPFELEVALQAELSWTGHYVLDFDQLLREHEMNKNRSQRNEELHGEFHDSDQPVFSLVSGTYRHAKHYGGDPIMSYSPSPSDSTSAMVLRNQDNTVSKMAPSAAAQFLQSRSYQGLEMRLGEDEPSVLEQGRSGIARGYGDDHRL